MFFDTHRDNFSDDNRDMIFLIAQHYSIVSGKFAQEFFSTTVFTRTNAAAFIDIFCAAAAFIVKFIPIELSH